MDFDPLASYSTMGPEIKRLIHQVYSTSDAKLGTKVFQNKFVWVPYRSLMLHAEINQILGNFHKFKNELLKRLFKNLQNYGTFPSEILSSLTSLVSFNSEILSTATCGAFSSPKSFASFDLN